MGRGRNQIHVVTGRTIAGPGPSVGRTVKAAVLYMAKSLIVAERPVGLSLVPVAGYEHTHAARGDFCIGCSAVIETQKAPLAGTRSSRNPSTLAGPAADFKPALTD